MWVLLNPVNAVLMTTYLTPLREEVENAAADLEQKADGEEDAEEKEKKRLKPAFKPDPRCAFPTAIQTGSPVRIPNCHSKVKPQKCPNHHPQYAAH